MFCVFTYATIQGSTRYHKNFSKITRFQIWKCDRVYLICTNTQTISRANTHSKLAHNPSNLKSIDMPALISYGNNNFRVLKKLGEGAFGTVYKVESQTSRHYALKMIQLQSADDKSREEVQHEVQILKRQANRHNNVIKYYDSWFRGSELCILMEYAPNGTLLDYIDHARQNNTFIPEMEVIHMLKQMLSALDFFHTKLNVVHRDVKPENMLIDQYGVIKLSDFGVSKQFHGRNNIAKTQAGSPMFMAPEVLDGRTYTYKVDVWGMGCIVYEMMALTPPFTLNQVDCDPFIAIRNVVRYGSVDFGRISGKYSDTLCKITHWMMQKDPEARPTAIQVLDVFVVRLPPTHPAAKLSLVEAVTSIQSHFRKSRANRHYGRPPSPLPFAVEEDEAPALPPTPFLASSPVVSKVLPPPTSYAINYPAPEPYLPAIQPRASPLPLPPLPKAEPLSLPPITPPVAVQRPPSLIYERPAQQIQRMVRNTLNRRRMEKAAQPAKPLVAPKRPQAKPRAAPVDVYASARINHLAKPRSRVTPHYNAYPAAKKPGAVAPNRSAAVAGRRIVVPRKAWM